MAAIDLENLKKQFSALINIARQTNGLDEFMVWLDVKVAEYKTLGDISRLDDEIQRHHTRNRRKATIPQRTLKEEITNCESKKELVTAYALTALGTKAGCDEPLDMSVPRVVKNDIPNEDSNNNNNINNNYDDNNPIRSGTSNNINNNNNSNNNSNNNTFVLDTGRYEIVPADNENTPETNNSSLATNATSFIKVVKQSKYLNLRKESRIIDGETCFVCPHCSKLFARSSNFSRHMRIHRGVYSYICSQCSRGFFRKEHFEKHKCYRRPMGHTWDRTTKAESNLMQKSVTKSQQSEYDANNN